MSVIGQPSLFGVAALAPHALDLAGLLLAGGATARWPEGRKTDDRKTDDRKTDGRKTDDRKTVKPRASAQVSVLVDHPWRASVLVLECARRGLAATCVAGVEQRICVRTAHSPLLVALADAWTDGPMAGVPGGLVLDGQPLRLWVQAAGGYERPGIYRLDCGLAGEADRQRVAAALAAAGLAADLVGTGRGCSFRISGKRRLTRLAEMVGDPPKRAPMDIWPS